MADLGALKILLFVCCVLAGGLKISSGCIWDSDTLAEERRKSPDMAELILGRKTAATDTTALNKRIERLKAKPRQTDPAWWNELAGAYLRLGQPQRAAEALEPLRARFPNDYGIHANLGTAYHLLGRYSEAEREIARDLELNPEAHFGLEVYHLALLQYLSRDADYQARHVYVDEFTPAFLDFRRLWGVVPDQNPIETNTMIDAVQMAALRKELQTTAPSEPIYQHLLEQLAALDSPPAYRLKWNLGTHPNFQKGVRYMAELNSSQPACFVMLGMACLATRDLNLAVAAFERAKALGSPQAALLDQKIARIDDHIREAMNHRRPWTNVPVVTVVVVGVALLMAIIIRRRRLARRQVEARR